MLAGSGDRLYELKRLVQRLELTQKVRFLGHYKDMNTLYRSSDVLLSASKMEGLPFNVMEALYCGTPVIASDIKGHKELIKSGYNGLMFKIDKHDPAAAAKLMNSVLSNKSFLDRLRLNTFLQDKFCLESVRPELVSVITGHRPSAEIKSPEGAFK